MIGYIEGKLLKIEDEKILLLAGNIGYEILLPAFVRKSIDSKASGDDLSLYIYYQQTERQPKPVLIGFNNEEEKEFFQLFISVEAIGPLKAAKALTIPVGQIASAIENKNSAELKRLKGIGDRTAKKIIASLSGRLNKFLLGTSGKEKKASVPSDLKEPVLHVLVNRLGHKPSEAEGMIEEAFKRNADISTPEKLFDEIYKYND